MKGKQNTKHISKQVKSQKAKQNKHQMIEQQPEPKQTKRARELFNAGINALNEMPQLDTGLSYHDIDVQHDSDSDGGFGSDFDRSDAQTVISLQSEMTIRSDELMDELASRSAAAELDDLLDALSNKDGNVRVEALLTMNEQLRSRRMELEEFTAQNMASLQLVTKHLAASIRRGSVNEKLYALDAVALLFLSLDDGLDFVMKFLQQIIKKLIQRPKHGVVQIKAIDTWAVMVWSIGDESTKLAALRLFEYFWNYNNRDSDEEEEEEPLSLSDSDGDDDEQKSSKRASTEILCASIDSWLFLIASIGSAAQIGSLLDSYCDPMLQLLRRDSTSIDAKISVGRALAVLIVNYQAASDEDGDFEAQGVNLDAVRREFEFLRSAQQHRKKGLLAQRAKFRDYLKTIEGLWTPLVVIKLHHKKFEVAGWNQWVQYHAVKKALSSGLQLHLLQNSKIKEVFGIDVEAMPAVLSKKDRKNKKLKNWESAQKTKKERARKRDSKRGFMFDAEVTTI